MNFNYRFLSIACLLGLASTASAQSIVLARIKADGTPNNQFGYLGGQLTDISSATEYGYQVVRDPVSGKFIVGGTVADPSSRFLLARYNLNGTLDNTFGSNGFVRASFANCNSVRAVSMTLNTGKTAIIMGGTCARSSDGKQVFAVARYTLAGALVNSFSSDGRTTGEIPDTNANPGFAVGVFDDDSVTVVGGRANTTSQRMGTFAWNNADGSRRTQYGSNGVATNFNLLWAQDMTTNTINGEVYMAGPYYYPNIGAFAYVSVSKAGNFGITRGTVFQDADAGWANAIDIDHNGKIVMGGWTHHATSATKESQFSVARMLSGSTYDPQFSTDGMTSTDFSSCDGETINDLFIYRSGPQAFKIMTCGSAVHLDTGRSQFALARYNTDGSLDTSFDGDGKVLFDFGLHVGGYGCVDDGSGGVVIVGTTLSP